MHVLTYVMKLIYETIIYVVLQNETKTEKFW